MLSIWRRRSGKDVTRIIEDLTHDDLFAHCHMLLIKKISLSHHTRMRELECRYRLETLKSAAYGKPSFADEHSLVCWSSWRTHFVKPFRFRTHHHWDICFDRILNICVIILQQGKRQHMYRCLTLFDRLTGPWTYPTNFLQFSELFEHTSTEFIFVICQF
jgi:hypothetical protein